MDTPKQMRDALESMLRYLDENDFDRALSLFSDDTYFQILNNPPVLGKKKLEEYYKRARVIKQSHHKIIEFLADGNRAAIRVRFNGEMKNGNKLEYGTASFYTFENGKIKESHLYTDIGRLDSK